MEQQVYQLSSFQTGQVRRNRTHEVLGVSVATRMLGDMRHREDVDTARRFDAHLAF